MTKMRDYVIENRPPSEENYFGYKIVVITFCLFLFRDSFQAALRYSLQFVRLDIAWYVVDALALVVVAIFLINQATSRTNFLSIFICFSFLFSLCISIFFTNDNFVSLLASIKMFAPIFVGYCFFKYSFLNQTFAKKLLMAIFLCSSIGLIINPLIDYPWSDFVLQGFGNEREANKLWWNGGKVRYGGLAGESTAAAFAALFSYILISQQYKFSFNFISWILLYFAIDAADSKTTMAILGIYIVVYLASLTINSSQARLKLMRRFATLSFLAILIPPLLILLLDGQSIGDTFPKLASLQDRIETTWQVPFKVVSALFPFGIFTGCGIGCFSYPMELSQYESYSVPFDNYFLSSYLMQGFPYLVIVAVQVLAIRRNHDETKLILLGLLNIYGITVQMYGQSMALMLMGYALSDALGASKRHL